MAGGKETPRQKMIGMMYLVLTALLALNVSKEIIEAFVTLDTKIGQGNILNDSKNDGTLGTFDQKLVTLEATKASPKEIENVKFWQGKAINVRLWTNSISNYLVGETGDMITAVERHPEGGDWVIEDDFRRPIRLQSGEEVKWKTVRSLTDISAKDNYDVATFLFVGGNMNQPVPRGMAILDSIHSYRDRLCKMMAEYEDKGNKFSFEPPTIRPDLPGEYAELDAALKEAFKTVNPEDTSRIKSVFKMLTLPVHQMNHAQKYPWIAAQFDHAPVVAAAAIFTALKSDILNAESIALEHLASKVKVEMFNFNKIEPLSFARSSYINVGDSVGIKVMIAAYDSTKAMKLRYWVNDSTKKAENMQTFEGMAGSILNLRGASPGDQTIYGDVAVEVKGVEEWKPWRYNYSVGQPMGVISAYELNVLYIGYPNKIQATASGFPKSSATCSGCTLSPDGKPGHYIAKVSGGKQATITVFGETADGKKEKTGDMVFRIFQMPTPTVFFGQQSANKSTIRLADARNYGGLNAKYEDSPLNVTWDVTEFEMLAVQNGKVVPMKTTGSRLSGQMKDAINKMGKGSAITFTGIKAKSSTGLVKELGAAAWKVQ
ncbi:MAG: GldM family protein [Flavobacteriales bacterium]